MKKMNIAAILLAAVMLILTSSSAVLAAEVVNTTIEAVSANAGLIPPVPSIEGALPKGNLLTFSRLNSDGVLRYWTSEGVSLSYDTDANGGFLRVSSIPESYMGARYNSGEKIEAGKYLFTGYFRTLRHGYLTELRLIFSQKNGESQTKLLYPTNEWLKVECYIELTGELDYIKVGGGSAPEMTQEYCMDQFSLVPVDEIPANPATTFGTPVTAAQVVASMGDSASEVLPWNPADEAKYDVQGVVVNHDFSCYFGSAADDNITEAGLEEFARQYIGTHVTDYYISVNDVCSNYPSEIVTSYLDKYYQKEENGMPVDYTATGQAYGSYYFHEQLACDPIGVLAEAFREIGINPWLSVRMNDAHSMTAEETSIIFSEFFHNHPEIRRVQHHNYVSYMDYVMDYTYDMVREYRLAYINEMLDRYDVYGLELDFQREIWLWHIGGEYNGLDILNDFMRSVNDIVSIYEEKYGHEILISVRVAHDIETNYECGLDVITWMTENLIDWIIPSCRFTTTNMDLPIRMWKDITDALDIVLVAGIDPTRLCSYPGGRNSEMDIESLSAAAANYLAQGAEKIYVFNYFRYDVFEASDKVTTKDPEKATMWSVLTTIGSYDKSMTMNRRCILSYADITPTWETTNAQLPKNITKNACTAFRIPVGNVLEGSKLMVKFSVSSANVVNNLPLVFVNSKPCEYVGADLCAGGYTDNMLLCYSIPESEYNDFYMVVELQSTTNAGFKTDYMEIYVQAPNTSSN